MYRILHLADIHVRNFSRHSEYRNVFEELVCQVKNEQIDAIFIGGDTFHTKNMGMSPECIEFMCWMFTTLANVAPLFVILGNHDLNLANRSRQDAITPIVKALGNDRITLYKQSGVYGFKPGWNFCVYSLFDKENWNKVVPEAGKINIACYHGGVRSSFTETGWAIEDGPSVDFFDNYNVVFLGDIHRYQYLGEPRGGKPWMAYPGTAVCQNYAEGDTQHGYIIWDLNDDGTVADTTFRELIQPNPFVTIDWDGNIQNFQENISKCVPNTRIRIRSSIYMSQEDIQKIAAATKKKGALELVFKSDIARTKDVFSAGGLEMMRDDLRNIEVQMLLLRDYYHELAITESEWDVMSSLVAKYMLVATQGDDAPRHTIWSLKNLRWDNLFTYGKNNEINFQKLSGIVGIFGPNACGKSSIPGTLMYSLFNTTDRGPIKNIHVVNSRKGFGESRVELSVDSADYRFTRETAKTDTRKGETIAATTLEVDRIDKDGVVSLNGEQRTDTEKIIRRLIGTQDDFLLTSMSTQGDLNNFIKEGSSFRKLILTKFLDLDIFQKMHDAAKNDVHAVSSVLKSMTQKNWIAEHKLLAEKVRAYDEFLAKADVRLDALRSDLHKLQVKIAIYENAAPVSADEVAMAKNRCKHLEILVKKHYEDELKSSDELTNLTKDLAAIRDLLKTYSIESLRQAKESGIALRDTLKNLKHRSEREEDDLEQIKKSVKRLEVVPCGDSFPTCMFIKDSHTDRARLTAKEIEIADVQQLVTVSTKALDDWTALRIEEKISEYDNLISNDRNLTASISKLNMSNLQSVTSLRDVTKQLSLETEKLSDLEIALKRSENATLVQLYSSVRQVQEEIKKFDRMKLDAASGRGKIESELIKLSKTEAEWNRLSGEMRIYELVANAFSKRGIPTRIINSQLPTINAAVAEILHGVVDYTVELVADEDSNAMEIFTNDGESRRIIELSSGMEKMFAALAIRVALHSVTSLPKTDIFILDEGFGVLDPTYVEACNRLLISMKKYFKTIVVITHVDAIKDVADSIIEITRKEKDSQVTVT